MDRLLPGRLMKPGSRTSERTKGPVIAEACDALDVSEVDKCLALKGPPA